MGPVYFSSLQTFTCISSPNLPEMIANALVTSQISWNISYADEGGNIVTEMFPNTDTTTIDFNIFSSNLTYQFLTRGLATVSCSSMVVPVESSSAGVIILPSDVAVSELHLVIAGECY